jgi:hypothetical protein
MKRAKGIGKTLQLPDAPMIKVHSKACYFRPSGNVNGLWWHNISALLLDSGVDKVDRLVARPQIVGEVFSTLPDEPSRASDTSNTASFISELFLNKF